jgi:hypothetical protein
MSDSILVEAFQRNDEARHQKQLEEVRKALDRFEDKPGKPEEIEPEILQALLAIHHQLQKVQGLNLKVEFSPYIQKVMANLDLSAAVA